ncbi:hypothetical protein COBT_002316 [Conglomerata obtusa]
MTNSACSRLFVVISIVMFTIFLIILYCKRTDSSMPSTTLKPIQQFDPEPFPNVNIHGLAYSSYLKDNAALAINNDATSTKNDDDLLILNAMVKNLEQQEIGDPNNNTIDTTTLIQKSSTARKTPNMITNANTYINKKKENKQKNTNNRIVNFSTTKTTEKENLGVETFTNNPLTIINDITTVITESENVHNLNDIEETTQKNTTNPPMEDNTSIYNEKESQTDTMPVLDTQNAISVTLMQGQNTTRRNSDKQNMSHTLLNLQLIKKTEHDKSENHRNFLRDNVKIKNCLGEIEILCAEKISRLIFLHTKKTTNENHFLHEVLCIKHGCGFKDRKTCIDKAKNYMHTQVKQCEKPQCIERPLIKEENFNQPTQKTFKSIWSKAYNSYPIYVSTPLHNMFGVEFDGCDDTPIDRLPLSLQFYKKWIRDLDDLGIDFNGNIKTIIYKNVVFVQNELEYSYLFMAENQNHDNEFFSLIIKAMQETNSYNTVNMPHNKSDRDLAGLCQKKTKHIVNAETLAIHVLFYPYCIGHVGFDISKDKRKEHDYYMIFRFFKFFVVKGVRVIRFKMEYIKQ